MATIKTAVSIDEELFKRTDRAARKQNLSRSRFVATALEEYLRHLENEELLERINASFSGDPDEGDLRFLGAGRKRIGQHLKDDEW